MAQRFDLGPDAPSKISVFLLEPAPFVLEGINVVGEAALTELLDDLKSRRNAYLGAVTVFDRARLTRFGAGGSALDFRALALAALIRVQRGTERALRAWPSSELLEHEPRGSRDDLC